MGSKGAARGGSDDPRVPDGALERLLLQLDCIGGRPFQVSELSGGLTNRNFRVVTPEADLVVRIAAANAGSLSIDRDNEYHNSVAAAAAGVGAPVVEYRPDLGVLVVGFIAARTFQREDLRSGLHLARVAAACRRLHDGPRFCNDFDLFELQRRYFSIVRERGYRLPDGYLGLAPPPPATNWGSLVSAGINNLFDGYWWQLWPAAIAIVATVVAINAVGDGLHDVVEKRLGAGNK